MPDSLILNEQVIASAAKAAQALDTFLLIRPEDYSDILHPYARNLIPCLTGGSIQDHEDLILKSRVAE
ncbi:MAG: hypothetical protein JRD87_16010, partial [Deltaproteobacteria bacterium]|nr:hypothetical protein [Deltaproteobacteria bacterium]